MSTFAGEHYPKGMDDEKVRGSDTLWLKITPKKVSNVNLNRRIDNINASESALPNNVKPLWFLMPNEWSYPITHSWEDLTTPASALRDVSSKLFNQGTMAVGTAGKKAYEVGDKADNPVLYTNSTRREFKLTFEFSVWNDTYGDVFEPIQNLITYSCPEIGSDFTQFDWPYIFSLQTVAGNQNVDVLSVKSVALTSVMPTFRGPWINGYPSSATIDLDFADLNPLYRQTLLEEQNRKISSSVKVKTNNRNKLQQLLDNIENARTTFRNTKNTITNVSDRVKNARRNLSYDEISRRIRR